MDVSSVVLMLFCGRNMTIYDEDDCVHSLWDDYHGPADLILGKKCDDEDADMRFVEKNSHCQVFRPKILHP